MDNVAIVAHFDANDRVETNFIELLVCLSKKFDRVVLVTTSNINEEIKGRVNNIHVVNRPNFGYDFCSYRVGLAYSLENFEVNNVLFTNSSFAILSLEIFGKTLSRMLEFLQEFDVVGSTESYQFSWHVQSYLILLKAKVVSSPWFQSFLGGIEPTNSKLEIITRFEIGLSSAFRSNNVKVATLLQPSHERLHHTGLNADGMREYVSGRAPLSSTTPLTPQFNPVHHLAELIAREMGYIKLEVLRDNPHQIDLAFVNEICERDRIAEMHEMLSRNRANYTRGGDNISTLKASKSNIPVTKLARWRRSRPGEVNVAVIVHLHYIEMVPVVRRLLKNIVVPFDVHVTTAFEGFYTEVFSSFYDLAQSVSIYCAENRGRDIGPFLSVYRGGNLDQYQAVLKIHSKKSAYSSNGILWRDSLYSSVAGDSLTVLRSIELIKSGEVGIVGPHQYYLTSDRFWGANRSTVRRLLEEMTGLHPKANLELGFFAGSMFWFAPQALSPLKELPESSLIFEAENGQQDGTLAHAIERVFCPVVRSQGFSASSVVLGGKDIHKYSMIENDVPVL
ncbi:MULTISPECIES: rhamnan synthesis F family protein [unclassified Mesorhizobium]|uniref:rhamnan synthesis F family protein n=1 Tax=unclassified Mesorhizobium TaxID=325217 RepID=UPI000BB0B2A1|nr:MULTISPECIES: rhamnan synthesis F family protein [unclassified Mesorhizobium]PBB87456.1 hypothetical protein CK216_07115 [Mesorhizobium sp. WSM3876]RWB88379.1 MAG: hypothetical protein EOQ52_14520 [Mesorhizobium sp.]RWE27792.1 MAG: hypothetical protein EOS41_02185 [Mesorhizobium sp.]